MLALGLGLPLALLAGLSARPSVGAEAAPNDGLHRQVLAWVPLLTAGFDVYQFAYIPGLPGVQLAWGLALPGRAAADTIWLPLLGLLRIAVLSVGSLVSIGVLCHLARAPQADGSRRSFPWGGLASLALYAGVLSLLFLRPQWLGL
jgi:hypothetical protein